MYVGQQNLIFSECKSPNVVMCVYTCRYLQAMEQLQENLEEYDKLQTLTSEIISCDTQLAIIPYSRKYWRGIIFGGFLVTPPILHQPHRLP